MRQGVRLAINVQKDEIEGEHFIQTEGVGYYVEIMEDITIVGIDATYNKYRSFCLLQGRTVDVHFNHNGKGYEIGLSYNPDTYPRV